MVITDPIADMLTRIRNATSARHSTVDAVSYTHLDVYKRQEEIFKVKVLSVNTINVRGKEKRVGVHTGYTAKKKKAIVRLTEDSKGIEIFEGMF